MNEVHILSFLECFQNGSSWNNNIFSIKAFKVMSEARDRHTRKTNQKNLIPSLGQALSVVHHPRTAPYVAQYDDCDTLQWSFGSSPSTVGIEEQ